MLFGYIKTVAFDFRCLERSTRDTWGTLAMARRDVNKEQTAVQTDAPCYFSSYVSKWPYYRRVPWLRWCSRLSADHAFLMPDPSPGGMEGASGGKKHLCQICRGNYLTGAAEKNPKDNWRCCCYYYNYYYYISE